MSDALLGGKACVITGAAAGIGEATSRVFAREGARLVLNDIDGDRLKQRCDELRATGADVVAAPGDVSLVNDCERMVATCIDTYGTIDVLVANAGIIPNGNILELDEHDWDRVMAVDGRGMFLVCKYAIAEMSKNRRGAIVCLSSISGVAGQPRQAAYGPAKFVASGLTKHLAIEWAEQGIRVNAVAPGTIATDSVKALPRDYTEPLREAHPMKRLGEPSEVAWAIAFLASDLASFITGVILPVDGGYLAQ